MMFRREVSQGQLKQAIDAAPGLEMQSTSERCCLCNAAPSTRFILKRDDGSVYMEFPVCLACCQRYSLTTYPDPDPEHDD